MAILEDRRRPFNRSACFRNRSNKDGTRLEKIDRQRLECGGTRQDGAPSLPPSFPVLCCSRKTVLSALPAFGGHLLGTSIQYSLLLTTDDDGCPGVRARAWRVRTHSWGRSPLFESHRSSQITDRAPALPPARDAD